MNGSGHFRPIQRGCWLVGVRFFPESARGWSAKIVVFGRTRMIQIPKLRNSTHALRTRRSRMGCH